MKRKLKKQDIIFLIIVIIIFMGIGGFALTHDREFHYLDHLDETFVTVDDKELPLRDLGFYIIYQETIGDSMAYEYDSKDNSKFWSRRANGTFISTYARQGAVSMAIHDEIFYQQALKRGITLSEDELEIAEQRLQDYLNAITVNQLDAVALTEEDIRTAIQKIALAEKYMIQYAQETGHYYEEYNITGDAYFDILQQHEVKENKYLVNKLSLGKISINPQTDDNP